MLGVGPSNPIRPSPPLVWPAARSAPPMPLRRSGEAFEPNAVDKVGACRGYSCGSSSTPWVTRCSQLIGSGCWPCEHPALCGRRLDRSYMEVSSLSASAASEDAFCSSSSPQARQHPQLRRAMKRRCAMRHDGLKRLAMLSPSMAVASRGLRRWLSSSSPRVLDSSAANAGKPARYQRATQTVHSTVRSLLTAAASDESARAALRRHRGMLCSPLIVGSLRQAVLSPSMARAPAGATRVALHRRCRQLCAHDSSAAIADIANLPLVA